MEEFNIKRSNNALLLSKDEQTFSISKGVDDDIWFGTSEEETSITIRLGSRNYLEWQTYLVFENLLKRIIGKYILEDYQDDYFPRVPKDFIDFENKTITWHSDSGTDNVLTLHFDNHRITITITKSKDAKDHTTNSVRIRTSGSEYDTFYQEFTEFYRQLWILEHELNKTLEPVQPKQEEQPQKLSLKNIFNPNKKN